MDTEISKLRRLNLIAGLLHLASLIGIIALSNDASMPVRATYLTDAPTLDAFSDPVHLFNLNISWMIAAFLALSAFFHFLIISPKFFPRYAAGLAARHNYFRWVEYSTSCLRVRQSATSALKQWWKQWMSTSDRAQITVSVLQRVQKKSQLMSLR